MALRNIIKEGNPLLREKCKEVTEFDDKLGELIDDMIDTMFKANGVGLAAPQIAVLKRIAVVSVDGETIYEMVNPVITATTGSQLSNEGCLSVPDRYGVVERPKKVVVEYYDRHGYKYKVKASGFLATAFCHEIDHLDGVLYIDKVRPPVEKKGGNK